MSSPSLNTILFLIFITLIPALIFLNHNDHDADHRSNSPPQTPPFSPHHKVMSNMPPKPKLNVHNFPRPPLCERTPRHLVIKWGGQTIADTREAYWVLETTHPPTYYLPPNSIKIPLTKTQRSSFCEWKGSASYYAVTSPSSPSNTIRDRIWSYDNPTEGFKAIKGYLSFYAGPWQCFVDDEEVVPQPGDFYGGWMTSDIDGGSRGVKGGPGTWGW